MFCVVKCPKERSSIEWKDEWKFKVGFSFHCHRSDELTKKFHKNHAGDEKKWKEGLPKIIVNTFQRKQKHLPNIIWTKGKNESFFVPIFFTFFKCAGSGLEKICNIFSQSQSLNNNITNDDGKNPIRSVFSSFSEVNWINLKFWRIFVNMCKSPEQIQKCKRCQKVNYFSMEIFICR